MELPIEKEHHHIDWEISAAEKGGYPHFMLKEIMEEPEALRRAITPRIKDGRIDFGDLVLGRETIENISRIMIIACGSSYHVGMLGKYTIEKLTRIPVEAVLASEFRYCDPIVDSHTLAIVISQSGETLDTMAALRRGKGQRRAGALDCERGWKLDRKRVGRRALHVGRTRNCRRDHEGILHAAGRHRHAGHLHGR